MTNFSYKDGLAQDQDGYWHYRFKVNGKPFKGELPSDVRRKFEAIKELDKIKVAVRKDASGHGTKNVVTIAKAIVFWHEKKKGVTQDYKDYSKKVMLRLFKDIMYFDVRTVTRADLETIVNHFCMTGKPNKKPSTINNAMLIIKSLFTYLMDVEEMIERSPAAKLKLLDVPKTKMAIVEPDEYELFLNEVDQLGEFHYSFVARMGIFLGLRSSEMVNAKWAYLNWNTREYTPGTHGLTKGKEANSLPVPEPMMDWFKKAVARDEKGLIYMIINPQTGNPYDSRIARWMMVKVSKKMGKHLTPHRLRASYITKLSQTLDLPTLQELSRHSDIETLMGYINVHQGRKKQAVEEAFKLA